MRAGLPETTARRGTSCVTTDPAPTIASAPMRNPGRIDAPPPIEAPRSTWVCSRRR
jgi:hypothetical protein